MESSLGGGSHQATQQQRQQTQGVDMSSSSVYGGGGGGGGHFGMMDFGNTSMMTMMMSSNKSGAGSASSSDSGTGFDMSSSALNDCTLAESLNAFLSYGDEETSNKQQQQQCAVVVQPPPPSLQQQHGYQTQLQQMLQQQQQQQALASTITMAPPCSLVNNLFSFHPQLGLVAAATAAGTVGMPTLPFFAAVAPVSATTNIASLTRGAGASGTTTTSSSSMAAPPPPRVAAKAASANPAAMKAATSATTTTTTTSSSASLPVPTLFGRAVALPPVSAPSRPLQLSPWELEQVKKKCSVAGAARGGGVAASATASSSSSFVATTTTPHLSLSQMQQKTIPTSKNSAKKRPRHVNGGGRGDDDISAVSEDDDDQEKRRQDRNQREQNRSQQITHQIDHLRNVLAAANVPFKPDKYSTLASVVRYIKELQEQSQGLDEEHAKLLQTITDTTEIMNNRYLPAQTTGTGVPTLEGTLGGGDKDSNKAAVVGSSTNASSGVVAGGCDPTISLLQGVDFKFIFQRCPVASAVTSIDGRFLDCNEQFEQICGFARQELLVASMKQEPTTKTENEMAAAAEQQGLPPPPPAATKNLSLFNILQQTDMERVYTAMSHMLQRPMFMNNNNNNSDNGNGHGEGSSRKSETVVSDDMWTEQVSLCRMDKTEVRLTLSLVRSPQEGRPRFFNCVLVAKEDSD